MAWTPTTFKDALPEFRGAPDAVVQDALDEATARTPADVWGAKQNIGIKWLAAHLLAMRPNARDLRKGERPGESAYQRERKKMAVSVSGGYRVAGIPEGLE